MEAIAIFVGILILFVLIWWPEEAMKYLLIFEDQTVRQYQDWDDGGGQWEESFEMGLLDIIRFSDGRFEQYTGAGTWEQVDD